MKALIRRLETIVRLRDDDRAALERLARDIRLFAAGEHIIREDAVPEYIHLMMDGWAARYKVLRDGSRQIVGFIVPGDFGDLHANAVAKMDHSIVALTNCRVAVFPDDDLATLTEQHPSLVRALWLSTLIDEAVMREWLLNVGRRHAYEAVAHLLCELHLRIDMAGLARDGAITMPLTQEDLADATAITPVHMNRTLKKLRDEGLISLKSRELRILDLDGLRKVADFRPDYFHRRSGQSKG